MGDLIIKLGTLQNKKDSVPSKAEIKQAIIQAAKEQSKEVLDKLELKNYFLYVGYCLVAASAGYRFINMLISNVVKEEKISRLINEKEELLKQSVKRSENSRLSQQKEVIQVAQSLASPELNPNRTASGEIPLPYALPVLSPVIHPDDPQKGRFGGLSERSGRKLAATVTKALIPDFYDVHFWVETTDPNIPLTNEVIFYIHDSFSPSVYLVAVNEEGRAEDKVLSYGAFTIGAITDRGETLLELDLAEDKNFPEEFRKR